MNYKSKLKCEDHVEVIAGKDKGRAGRVIKKIDSWMFVVEKVNFVKRHTKHNARSGHGGGIVEKENPIHVSNLMLICQKCFKPVKVKKKKLENGVSVRICKVCGESVEKN